MKGIAVWVWVIGGIIVGLTLFASFFQVMSVIVASKENEAAKQSIDDIAGMASSFCELRSGSSTVKRFVLPNAADSVFASEDRKTASTRNNTNYGQYLCVKTSGLKETYCVKTDCEIELALNISPKSVTSIFNRIVGRYDYTEYSLRILRTECGVALLDENKIDSASSCRITTSTTTSSTSTTTTAIAQLCSPESLVNLVDTKLMLDNIRYLIQQPREFYSSWDRETADYVKSKFESHGLADVHFEDFYSEDYRDQNRNVVGEIGTGDKIIVVGAHRDTAIGCPGAVDNAAGVASVMEAARVLATCKDSIKTYKLKFVIFDKEELYYPALWGSRDYASRHENENIRRMINFDCLGLKENPGLTIFRTAEDLSNSADKACQYLGITCDKRGQAPCRSDQCPFGERGIDYLFAINYGDFECGRCYHCTYCSDDMSQIDSTRMERVGKFAVYVLSDLYLA